MHAGELTTKDTGEESSKRQHPSSREIPSAKPQTDETPAVWSLKLEVSLVLGAWDLELVPVSLCA
jgi:hypothetical protein